MIHLVRDAWREGAYVHAVLLAACLAVMGALAGVVVHRMTGEPVCAVGTVARIGADGPHWEVRFDDGRRVRCADCATTRPGDRVSICNGAMAP